MSGYIGLKYFDSFEEEHVFACIVGLVVCIESNFDWGRVFEYIVVGLLAKIGFGFEKGNPYSCVAGIISNILERMNNGKKERILEPKGIEK